MKAEKIYTIIRSHKGNESFISGTLSELIKNFTYKLDCGKSWEHEKGNKKINTNPKTISSLITNINNACDNSASNGYSSTRYSLKKD